jgi:hypothetical protein
MYNNPLDQPKAMPPYGWNGTAGGIIIPQGSPCDLSNNVHLLLEWKQDSNSSQDFGDRGTIMRELQRASGEKDLYPSLRIMPS